MSFTKSDKQFLKDNFATKDDLVAMEKRQDKKYATKDDLKSFATKDDLKEQLKDQREQILDAVDGKLAIQKKEIVKDVADFITDTIVPMFEKKDEQIVRIEKKLGLQPLAD